MIIKKLIATFILCLVLVHSFQTAAILFRFYANQAAIAERLCENKNRPQLKCKGRCQLGKALAKAANEEKGTQSSFKLIEFHYLTSTIDITHPNFLETVTKVYGIHLTRLLDGYRNAVFQPPGC